MSSSDNPSQRHDRSDEPGSALTTTGGKGTTTIDESVVGKIASMAAREVEGVARLGGAVSSTLANVVGRIRGDEHETAGVGVEVGERQAAADLTMMIEYPHSIPEVTQSVRENVISRVEELTGLEVVEVNIAVTDLAFPGEEDEDNGQQSRVQ